MSIVWIMCMWPFVLCNGWAPSSKVELQAAIKEGLQLSADCSEGSHGPIGSWDVSAVTHMTKLLYDANRKLVSGADKFTGDISKWDVSRATTMLGMFASASAFNGDISKFDVARVTIMFSMFYQASSFNS